MSLLLDTTGVAPINLVSNEIHPVTPQALANFGYIFLTQGPFFGGGLSVSYTPAGGSPVALTLGIDYQVAFELLGFGATEATKVWGAVEFINPNLHGSLRVTYQALGGNWTFAQTAISNYLNSNAFNGTTQKMVLVPATTLYLPTNPYAPWPLNSIPSITIAQAQESNIALSVEYVAIGSNGNEVPAPNQVQVMNWPPLQSVNAGHAFVPSASSGAFLVTDANTNQIAVSERSNRKFLEITNTHLSATLILNVTGPAYVGGNFIGVSLLPGAVKRYEIGVPSGNIHIASSVVGASYFVVEG